MLKLFPLSGREVSLREALINLSMLQDWFGVKNVDGVYWTLTVELSFYVVMYLALVTGGLKHMEGLGVAWLTLMLIHDGVLKVFHHQLPRMMIVSNLLGYGHLFVAGILFYHLKTKGNAWYRHLGVGVCAAVHHVVGHHGVLMTAAPFALFYLFIFQRLSWIAQRPLVYLGTISYSLYLIHQNLGYEIITRLSALHANAWVRIMVPLMGSLLLATMLTYGVEKPVMNYVRGMYKRSNPLPKAEAS